MTSPRKDKKLAILQSNYIPWKGYVDIIGLVDEFVIYDDAQFTRRDWRNRNKIKTPRGCEWLTIPVDNKGKFTQAIKDTRISDAGWCAKHWEAIRHNYSKAEHFAWCAEWLQPLYAEAAGKSLLSDVNYIFLQGICRALGITTTLSWSMDYSLGEGKSEKLLAVCLQAGAATYLSGPAAKDYLDVELFARHGIAVEWMDYSGYPEYRQAHPPFEHKVSIIDLFMNEGAESGRYIKSKGLA